jgi:uncharacterized protein YciI
MATFAVTMVHGPGWDPARGIRDQDAWDAHAAFMDGLVDEGFVVLGGPVGDRQRVLLVIEAVNLPAVRDRLAADPWAVMGLLRVGAVEPWALWLDGRTLGAGR